MKPFRKKENQTSCGVYVLAFAPTLAFELGSDAIYFQNTKVLRSHINKKKHRK